MKATNGKYVFEVIDRDYIVGEGVLHKKVWHLVTFVQTDKVFLAPVRNHRNVTITKLDSVTVRKT